MFKDSFVIFLFLFCTYVTFSASQSNITDKIQNTAQSLNVPVLQNWIIFMMEPKTTGVSGYKQIQPAEVNNLTTSWPIRNAGLKQKVVSGVYLMAMGADATYKGELFLFNNGQQASLDSVLVVVHRLSNYTEIAYLIIETSAIVKQQYTATNVKTCHFCFPKMRCCHQKTVKTPRGDTPTELGIIINKMKGDQYNWVTHHLPKGDTAFLLWSRNSKLAPTVSTSSSTSLEVSDTGTFEEQMCILIQEETQRLNNTLHNPSYSLSFSSLAFSMNHFQVKGLPPETVPLFLKSLAEDEEISPIDVMLLKLAISRMTSIVTFEQSTLMDDTNKFLWLMVRKGDGIDVDVITSKFNAKFNVTQTNYVVMEMITLSSNPNEAPEQQNLLEETDPLLDKNFFDSLRLITLRTMFSCPANTLRLPRRHITIDPPTPISPLPPTPISPLPPTPSPPNAPNWINYVSQLTSAVSSIVSVWKDFASAIKTTITQKVCDVFRLGFTHYMHQTNYLKVIDLPAFIIPEFVDAMIQEYNLPLTRTQIIAFDYARNNITWQTTSVLFQQGNQNQGVNYFMVVKALNPTDNSMSFIISSMHSEFALAPNLRVVTTDKSYLGGIFESHKTKIQEIPPTLSLNDVMVLTEYFRVVAFASMSDDLGVKFEWPQIPPETTRCY